jgi:FkbM family methyltransferase
MKITYGITENDVIDVTEICKEQLLTTNNIIVIPYDDDNREKHFTDPYFGIKKKIFIEIDGIISEYEDHTGIAINMTNNKICTIVDVERKLENIHSKLKLNYGTLEDELPEQKMIVKYLKGDEKILEIGGNIGRSSLVIGSILENTNNLLTLESDENISKQLIENRDSNNMKFHIESSALSKRKLIQKDWDSKPSETLEPEFKWVNTITLEQLKMKYNINFDTLVLDCEGAFYYILMDMPEILDNINLIIMENDYHNFEHKQYIDNILIKNNFYVDYTESGGWGPCYNNFFETWKKSV